jgi:hypothetical protein
MVSDKAVEVLAAMPFREDAEWEVGILPFGSVYWADEMPDIKDIFDKPEDMMVLMKMFGLRLKIWDGKALTADEMAFWDALQRQVPNWALFKRLTLTDEQRLAREQAERQVMQEFDSLDDRT